MQSGCSHSLHLHIGNEPQPLPAADTNDFLALQIGELDGAALKDVKIENINITVADEVYEYVKSGDFATMMGATLKELTVGSLAAVSTNGTKIEKVEVLEPEQKEAVVQPQGVFTIRHQTDFSLHFAKNDFHHEHICEFFTSIYSEKQSLRFVVKNARGAW